MTTRSTLLAFGRNTVPNVTATLYTVPAGIRTLWKSVIVGGSGAGTANGWLYHGGRAGTPSRLIAYHFTGCTSTEVVYGDRWLVLNAGELIECNWDHNFNYMFYGTELPAP